MKNSISPHEDKRVQRSKDSILAVTYKLLTEEGIGGLSVDEVSRRSGVSKTTIYRHWPSRSALLMDACSKIGPAPVIPDTGTLKGDVTALATGLAQQLKSARWAARLSSFDYRRSRAGTGVGAASRSVARRSDGSVFCSC